MIVSLITNAIYYLFSEDYCVTKKSHLLILLLTLKDCIKKENFNIKASFTLNQLYNKSASQY